MNTSMFKTYLCLDFKEIIQVFPISGCDFSPTAISNIKNAINVKVYPVPTENTIMLEFDNSNFKQIKIFGVQDNLKESFNSDKNNLYLDISSYSKGIYFIHIEETGKTSSFKIIKR